MSNDKKRAGIFVFTSFQGGIGKSSTALHFAHSMKTHTGMQGALLEVNLFSPSYLVEHYNAQNKLKSSCLDFFMKDWVGFQPEEISETFTEVDGLYLIPFTGNRSKESVAPRFSFNETDLTPAMERLLSCLSRNHIFSVFDLPLAFTPFPLYLLDIADCIFYVYSSQSPSPNFAKQFLWELERIPNIKNKVVFLRNMVDPDSEDRDTKTFDREYLLPISGGIPGTDEEIKFDSVIKTIVEKAYEMPSRNKVTDAVANAEPTKDEPLKEYQKKLRSEIVSSLEKRFGLTDQELRKKVEQQIEQTFQRNPPPVVQGIDAKIETKKFLLDEILGLGPLEEFIRDQDVDEIMVNGPTKIFVEKKGKLLLTDRFFNNSDHVRTVIDRILMPVGRMVNERTPYVDARLSDGSRVHAIIPPLSLTGPMLTIRRFSRVPYTMDDLIYRFKTITVKVSEFLKLCLKFKKNVIVSGGASSGKTTLLNVLSTFINPDERVILIEDSAELRLNHNNLGRLEARQQGTEAKTQVTIRDLVRNSLRMRPDRIIVGECRGEEALDMLQAMNTGHDGSLTTLHANSPRDALARLETMVLMAGVELPLRAIREQIASSVNIIVQTSRLADGTRKVVDIVEVTGIEDTNIKTETIFKFEKKWINEDGRVFGDIVPTGVVPLFIKNMPGNLLESTAHLFKGEERSS